MRIGKATRKQAEALKAKVETIIADRLVGRSHDPEVLLWLGNLDERLRMRFQRVGLVASRRDDNYELGAFLEDFLKSAVVKSSTATTYAQTKRCLLEFFGSDRSLKDVRPIDADQWRQWLKGKDLADSTISRRVKTARQAFRRAMKWKLVTENPFADVVAGPQTNKARMYFVTGEQATAVLDACPDAQWRLLFALSRYGGLRCPSEHLALRWSDIDWERGRVRVPSSKTEHLEGGDCRFIPLFPELRPYLLDVFESAAEGSQYVISRYRDCNANLRTQLIRIIHRAGLKPWPKLFHNLRSTRQTELAEKYPIHVVCAWLGNSRAVAQEHYLQVTDAHFAQAAQIPAVAQKAAQSGAALASMVMNSGKGRNENRSDFPSDSASCDAVQNPPVTPTGFEPVSRP